MNNSNNVLLESENTHNHCSAVKRDAVMLMFVLADI